MGDRYQNDDHKCQCYVSQLGEDTTEDDLQGVFDKYGHVSHVKVIRDHDTQVSKGFGFVKFDTQDEANAAVEGVNGEDINGSQISVQISRPRRNDGFRGGRGGGGRGGYGFNSGGGGGYGGRGGYNRDNNYSRGDSGGFGGRGRGYGGRGGGRGGYENRYENRDAGY